MLCSYQLQEDSLLLVLVAQGCLCSGMILLMESSGKSPHLVLELDFSILFSYLKTDFLVWQAELQKDGEIEKERMREKRLFTLLFTPPNDYKKDV